MQEVDLTHHTHGKHVLEKQKSGNKASGLNLEELRSLGMVWEKPQNVRSSSEVTQAFSLEGPRQSLRPRQSRISVVIEQESDLQTWEMMLKKAAPTPQKAACPEHLPPNEPGIGMPWTWQSSSIDAVDANQHKDSLTSREQTKSGRWNRKSYIWQFRKEEEEEDKTAAEAKEVDPAGSLGKRHEALGIRSRSSTLRLACGLPWHLHSQLLRETRCNVAIPGMQDHWTVGSWSFPGNVFLDDSCSTFLELAP